MASLAPPSNDSFWFVIPLRGKQASSDWNRVCALLRDTLRSALNQTDPRFGILIACQDAPDLGDINDPRIEILQDDFPVPTTLLEQALDKRAKKRLAAVEIHKRGGGYIMLLDSDDLVSRHIVQHVRDTLQGDGYYFPEGFEYFPRDGLIRRLPDFYKRCGSCYIVHYEPDALPASPKADETPFDAFKNHRLILETAADLGLELTPVPFPAAVYIRENGENHSAQVQAARRISRHKVRQAFDRLARRFGLRGNRVTSDLAAEFSLPSLGRPSGVRQTADS